MKSFFSAIQITAAIFAIILILLQQKGAGLGSTFGGDTFVYQTRRGAEKLIFGATIFFVAVFVITSFLVTQIF